MLEIKTNEAIKVKIDGKEVNLRRPNVLDIINLNDVVGKEGVTPRESYEANKEFLQSLGLPTGVYDKLSIGGQDALIKYLNDMPKK